MTGIHGSFPCGIENGIEYRYFSRYHIEDGNSSIVTTLIHTLMHIQRMQGLHEDRQGLSGL